VVRLAARLAGNFYFSALVSPPAGWPLCRTCDVPGRLSSPAPRDPPLTRGKDVCQDGRAKSDDPRFR